MNPFPAAGDDRVVAQRPAAMVNKHSGERAAAAFVREQLIACLGADSVFDLFPNPGQPPAIEEAKAFLLACKPDMLIIAGGDGTVSLGMDLTDSLRREGRIGRYDCPVAVLPMGTGNDLSRSLGFGGGYTKPAVKAEVKFQELLERMKSARQKLVDRFQLDLYVAPATNDSSSDDEDDAPAESGAAKSRDTAGDASDPPVARPSSGGALVSSDNPMLSPRARRGARKVMTKNLMNYFSVGFDADIAANFGEFRDKHPKACTNRTANKMWYGCFGCQALCCSSPFPKNRVSLRIDGQKLRVPSKAEAIVVSNMLTYAGGAVLWRDERKKFLVPAVDDTKAEVCVLNGVIHVVGIGTKTRSARKMGQGSRIRIRVPADYVMQYDGEPVPAPGGSTEDCIVYITHSGQSLGMELPKEKRDATTSNEGG